MDNARSPIECFLTAKAQEMTSSPSFRVGVKNAQGDGPAEIILYGEIGNPYTAMDARSVGNFLRANRGKPVNVRINSPGGLAFDGITIHNALLDHDGQVTTIIDGQAGSSASIIAMAGNPVLIKENASIYIHRAMVIVAGNRDVTDEATKFLDKIDDAIARTYRAKTGMALEKLKVLMKGTNLDGTLFSAQEALDGKWVDQVIKLKRGEKAESNAEPRLDSRIYWNEAERRMGQLEVARAERIRSRRELFSPAE